MAGHRPWRDIRGDADRDPERRRRVVASRREAEEEGRAYEHTLAELRRARAYDHPEEQLTKAEIVARIARIIEERALTQAQAAEVMGVAQPNVSDLLRGRFRGYSLDRLFRLLVALDGDVSIVIGPKREGCARLSVTARSA